MYGRDEGQSKTAIAGSHDDVVQKSSKQPSAQHPGSDLNSMNPNEEIQPTPTQISDTRASSSMKRSSEDVNIRGTKRVRRSRKAEGLPCNYCFQCEEEHPWPDEDGTTHHTKPYAQRKHRNKKRRYEEAEPAQELSATADQHPVQRPPQTVLQALERDPSIKDSFDAALRETDTDAEKMDLFFSIFEDAAHVTHPWARNVLADAASASSVPQTVRAPALVDGDPTRIWRAEDHELMSNFEWPAQPSMRGHDEDPSRGDVRGSSKHGGRSGDYFLRLDLGTLSESHKRRGPER